MNQRTANQAKIFRRFAVEAREMSPYYAFLSLRVADDRDLLSVVSVAGRGQPSPNLFFASVRLLLDRGMSPELLGEYPTDFGAEKPPVDSYRLFREFVLHNRSEIERLVSSRRVQSNIVRRTAVLLLGLMKVAELFEHRPFANVEIGASAGLTLLWQKYSFRYGDQDGIGRTDSPVRVTTEMRGAVPFSGMQILPNVTNNTGIEIDPVLLDDEDSISWLRALNWPEHGDNRVLFDAAIDVARSDPPTVLGGDALELLPKIISDLPADQPANIYHSHTLNQFSPESRVRLDEIIVQASSERHITRLAFEGPDPSCAVLTVIDYADGTKREPLVLANCEPHGRWIEWLLDPMTGS